MITHIKITAIPRLALMFVQANIRNKVNASDLASLMPQGDSGEGASLMPKVLEVQTRVTNLEGIHSFIVRRMFLSLSIELLAQVQTLPSTEDVQDQMSALRSTVDTQTEELSTVRIP